MPTLNGDAASSAAQTQTSAPTPEPSLPAPVGFGDSPQQPSDAKDVSPDSSPGVETKKPDAKEPENLLAAVRNVVDATRKEASQAEDSSTSQGDGTAEPSKPEAQQDGPEGDDDSKLPFHNHPRWKQVIAERDSFKNDATQYQQVVSFMRSNGLSPKEVADGMQIMALIKNDPMRGLEALRPTIENLRQFSGEALPADIAKKVDEGFMDKESAAELARQRNQAAFLAQRQQAEWEATQVAQQQQVAQAQSGQMMNAVAAWEAQVKTRDADYQTKSQFIADRVRVLLGQGQPQTPQEAIALAERAYNEVNESFKSILPRRQPVRAVTSGASATSATPAPKSLREAIIMAAGR